MSSRLFGVLRSRRAESDGIAVPAVIADFDERLGSQLAPLSERGEQNVVPTQTKKVRIAAAERVV